MLMGLTLRVGMEVDHPRTNDLAFGISLAAGREKAVGLVERALG